MSISRVSACQPFTALLACLLLALSACGGGSSPAPAPPPAPEPPATLTLAGSSAQVLAGGKPVALTATASANAGTLNWTLGAGNPGSLSATTGANVNYLPPAASAVSANTPVAVTVSGTGVSKSFALTVFPDPGPPGLSLIAGTEGGNGHLDGVGTAARFYEFIDVASDAQGTLYVGGPHEIRTVSPAAVVSTLLSTPAGTADGPKASATLDHPTSIVAGPDGTLYFVDSNGIRKRDSAGDIITITREFNNSGFVVLNPYSGPIYNANTRVLLDGAGNLLVMEFDRISKVSPAGVVSSFAGTRDGAFNQVDGEAAAARFSFMTDMTIDKNGNLYVLDRSAVRKVSPSGAVTTLAGASGNTPQPSVDGAGSAARFNSPLSIAVDAQGSLLVLDRGESIRYETPFVATTLSLKTLRKVTANGVVSTVKTGLHPFFQAARSGADGRVYLLGRNQVSLLASDGSAVPFAGLDDDTIVDVDGRGAEARLRKPRMIAADLSGNLYVTGGSASGPYGETEGGLRLRRIAPDGTVTTLVDRGIWWGKPGAMLALITEPSGIVTDRQGNLYISETSSSSRGMTSWGGSIVKITPDGVASVFAGKHDSSTEISAGVDGVGQEARFGNARVRGFDNDGNLYVQSLGTVRKITPDRVVTTVAALPPGLDADAEGNVYVREEATVVRVSADGTRTVVAGVPGERINKLGPLPGYLYSGSGQDIARTGPASFAVSSGSAILKLVVPH